MAIVIPVELDTRGLQKRINDTSSGLSRIGKVAAVAAGAAAFGALVETLKIGTKRFLEHEKIAVRTDAVIKSTGSAAHVTAKQVDELAKSIMSKTGIDNEQLQAGENILLQFRAIANQTGKNNDIFDQATVAMSDLSVVMGGNTTMAAKALGKALQDPEKAMGALKRSNVTFTDSEKDAIKFLDHHNRTLEAQKMVLEAVTRATGGQAEALGTTLQGKLNIASLTFKNLAMDIAGLFMPALAGAATHLADFFRELSSKGTMKAKVDFIFETAESVASRFWTWWTQPSMTKVRSPTSGVHVVFTPPGSEQVDSFVRAIDSAANAKLNAWARGAGYDMLNGLFSGASASAGDKTGSGLSWIIKIMNPQELGKWSLGRGAQLLESFWNGMQAWLKSHPGVATKAIKDWLTSAGDALSGAAGSVWDSVSRSLRAGPSRGILHAPTVAKIITNDMKAAVQSARGGLQSAATSLASMFAQITSATLEKSGIYGNAAAMTKQQRDLEDRRLSIQEDSLKAALAATEDGSAEQKQAQLDLDQFYYDKSATLRQRDVDDENSKNQTKIESLADRFNKGLISAQEFSTDLDVIIGADRGSALGDAFATAFTNALASIKNAAADIFGIVAGTNALGPDVGASGGPVASAALQAYNDALSKWQDRQDALAKKVKDLRDKANDDKSPGGKAITADEKAAIDKAVDARDAHRDSKPNKKDYGLALGGILTGPRVIAGEAGNEAVIPLGSPTAAQMMRKAFSEAVNGSGDTVYNISITAGMGADGSDIGRQIVEAIKVFERRNGPVFAGA
jgi:hypothetical protein